VKDSSNLLLRSSAALDFVTYLQNSDGSFTQFIIYDEPPQDNPYSLTFHLQATSLLLSCSKTFGKGNLRTTADKAYEFIKQKYEFKHKNSACIIDNNESITMWNTLMAIIVLKQDKDATPYLNNLKHCICENNIDAKYAPATNEEEHDIKPPIGAMVLTFLEAYKKTKQSEYLDTALKIGERLISKANMDSYDMWAMRFLHNATDNPNYKKQAQILLNNVNSIAIESMSSVVAAMVQRINIAWLDIFPENSERCKNILEFQKKCQDMRHGAFMKVPNQHETHLSDTIYNIYSMIEYLVEVENREDLRIPVS